MSSVDVIVPCYNYGRFLRQCVRSALEQEGVTVRVLVLDDASTDGSAEVATELAAEDSRVTFVHHVRNHGHIATYNEGLAWVRADYVLLISADDYLLPGALARAADALDVNPQASFVFGGVVELSADGQTELSVAEPLLDGAPSRVMTGTAFIDASGARNYVATPAVIVRGPVQRVAGGYRSELPHTGDMEMWMRLAAFGSVVILRDAQAVWRRHGNNMSRGYSRRGRLPELRQKQAAFDAFFARCSALLPDPSTLRRRLVLSLAEEAIACASAAFNEEDMSLVDEIAAYGLELSPDVKHSAIWRRLQLKRRLGTHAWSLLAPAHRLATTLSRPRRATDR